MEERPARAVCAHCPPGVIEIEVGSSSADLRLRGELSLSGPERRAGADRVLTTPVVVNDL